MGKKLKIKLICFLFIFLFSSIAVFSLYEKSLREDIYLIYPQKSEKTYQNTLAVKLIARSLIDNVRVNNNLLKLDKQNSIYSIVIPLHYGKQELKITYEKDQKSYELSKYILRLPKFDDVSEKRWSKDVIEYLAVLGLYWGKRMPQEFLPQKNLNVIDLAEIVAKYKRLKTGATLDIEQAINDIVSLGKELGYKETIHRNMLVNRALACAVLTKIADIKINKAIKSDFYDVSLDSWYADRVLAAKANGLITGVIIDDKLHFEPEKYVSREVFLTFLRPLLDQEIKNLKIDAK